jgi:hypothetical protein
MLVAVSGVKRAVAGVRPLDVVGPSDMDDVRARGAAATAARLIEEKVRIAVAMNVWALFVTLLQRVAR